MIWVASSRCIFTTLVYGLGAQGKGIFLWNASHGPLRRQDLHRKCVAQEYIPSPLLIDGCKFDMRLYVGW